MAQDYYILQGYQLVTLDWILLLLTFLLITLRLYVRIHLRTGFSFNVKSWWRWSDFFIILSFLCFLYTSSSDSVKNDYNVYGTAFTPQSTRILIQRLLLIDTVMYFSCMYALKAAMICFYAELVSAQSSPRLYNTLRVTLWVLGVNLAYVVVGDWLGCFPVQLLWNNTDNFDICATQIFYGTIFPLTIFPMHILTDIIVYSLPFFIIRRLHRKWTKGQAGGVYIMFALGFISTACAILNFALLFYTNGNKTVQAVRYITQPVEESVGILVACCPAFKFFITRIGREGFRRRRNGSVKSDEVRLTRKGTDSSGMEEV